MIGYTSWSKKARPAHIKFLLLLFTRLNQISSFWHIM